MPANLPFGKLIVGFLSAFAFQPEFCLVVAETCSFIGFHYGTAFIPILAIANHFLTYAGDLFALSRVAFSKSSTCIPYSGLDGPD